MYGIFFFIITMYVWGGNKYYAKDGTRYATYNGKFIVAGEIQNLYKQAKENYRLLENDIIARGPSDSLYFINPMVAFNGDRVTFAKTYVKKQNLTIHLQNIYKI